MTLPLKLRILHALTDAIKTITPANGYQSDLSDFDPGDGVMTPKVFRGIGWYGDEHPLPLISVLEGTHPADTVAEAPINTPVGEYDWNLLVQGFVKDDKVNPTDPAYVLLADVRRRLAAEAKRRDPLDRSESLILGFRSNKITDMMIGSGVVRPADDVSAVAYFWMTLTLRIIDDAETPYE